MMSRFCAGVMVVSANTGMDSGPVSIASNICVLVDWVSAGEVVALRAVGDEQILPERRVRARGAHLGGRRDGGAAAQRGHVRRERVNLLWGERHRLAVKLGGQ